MTPKILRTRHLLLPLAAIRARAAHARMGFISYTMAFVLFGFAASLNATLKHLAADHRAQVRLDGGTVAIVLVGLATALALNSHAVALSVRSHLRELAILRAVGFSSPRIVSFVFLEAAIPAALGALLGLLLSQPLALWTLHLFPKGEALPFHPMSGGVTVLAILAVASLLVLSVLAPAHRVLCLDVISTLSDPA